MSTNLIFIRTSLIWSNLNWRSQLATALSPEFFPWNELPAKVLFFVAASCVRSIGRWHDRYYLIGLHCLSVWLTICLSGIIVTIPLMYNCTVNLCGQCYPIDDHLSMVTFEDHVLNLYFLPLFLFLSPSTDHLLCFYYFLTPSSIDHTSHSAIIQRHPIKCPPTSSELAMCKSVQKMIPVWTAPQGKWQILFCFIIIIF